MTGGIRGPARRLATTLYVAPWVHALVPARLALWLSRRVARRLAAGENPLHDRARDFVTALLAHTARAPEAEVLAGRWLEEAAQNLELHWRPWLMRRGRMVNREIHDEALATGRGIVLTFIHTGPIYAVWPSLRHAGIDQWLIVGPHHLENRERGLSWQYFDRGRDYLLEAGRGHMVAPPGVHRAAAAVLRGGGLVVVAFDIPGTTPTPFLGREVGLAGGAARLATETGALVLPIVSRRRGPWPQTIFTRTLDPHDHPDADSLQAAIARRFEAVALERPEDLYFLEEPPPLVTPVREADQPRSTASPRPR
jgi:lauroyl/myristoyl acyltransferase